MNWAVGITTAPRPEPTLERTEASLRKAGWSDWHVFRDTTEAGSWPTWIRALGELTRLHPDADAYMMVQDDALFCRDLRPWLERQLWPSENTALVSPYCPGPYKRNQRGWHNDNCGWYMIGAVCWVIPPEIARRIVTELGSVKATQQIDGRVGLWASGLQLACWYHTPSLVQHDGLGNSALHDHRATVDRTASDFIGEDAAPRG